MRNLESHLLPFRRGAKGLRGSLDHYRRGANLNTLSLLFFTRYVAIALNSFTKLMKFVCSPRFPAGCNLESVYSNQFPPILFPFRPLPSNYLSATICLGSRVVRKKSMEKVERLIRTWVATQQEAQVTETVAGEPVPLLDPSTIRAKIMKRYPAAKSPC